GLGFRVQGSGFRVQGSGFRVQSAGFRVQGSKKTTRVNNKACTNHKPSRLDQIIDFRLAVYPCRDPRDPGSGVSARVNQG
ncbi:hypothetical protein T484DRAFT_1641548, partial [Baffinella frigidus]